MSQQPMLRNIELLITMWKPRCRWITALPITSIDLTSLLYACQIDQEIDVIRCSGFRLGAVFPLELTSLWNITYKPGQVMTMEKRLWSSRYSLMSTRPMASSRRHLTLQLLLIVHTVTLKKLARIFNFFFLWLRAFICN